METKKERCSKCLFEGGQGRMLASCRKRYGHKGKHHFWDRDGCNYEWD
jgi:hypothetical protein